MSLANKLAEERRARLAAERLLELKQAELFAANRKLGQHAKALSDEIVETRAQVATYRDENQRVKSDLTAAREKIEIAERRLWLSIETIQDGFAFFDDEDRMIAANNAYVDFFDGLREVRPGITYPRILQLLTEEGIVNIGDMTPTEWRTMMMERWQSPAPEPFVMRSWNDQYIRLVDQRGRGGDVVSLALNITANVRYEAELHEARMVAEAANRAKSAFLATISHEIRTPMNGVVGMADLLSETTLTEEQQLYVTTIRNSGQALLVIINDVLDYSKIEAEKLVLHPEPFDLEHCLHELVMLLQPGARDKGLCIVVDYDLFLPSLVIGDPGRIRQVLTNLMGNAVKFTARGHVVVRVAGTTTDDGKCQLHITVEDTGIGIAPDKIDHVFGEFNQVESEKNRQFEGTGLGLAISRRLIELMGGTIWVDSDEGRGSVFGITMTLPVAEANPDMPALPGALRRVLIVETLAVNRRILEKQMALLGLSSISCDSGAEALDAFDDGIDLVLTSYTMPGMNGLELATALKARKADVPIMLLSSNPGSAEHDPAHRHVQAVLNKPTPRAQLVAQLAKIGASASGVLPQRADIQRDLPKAHGRAMRILAAEDNRTNRLVFQKMVQDMDIDLEFAGNGTEAIAHFETFAPDLIFMDISMPGMDGKTATAKIRALPGGHVPIVAMTAHAMDGDREGVLDAGLDDYLTKPLRKAAIREVICAHCPADARPPQGQEPRNRAIASA
ncbi:response regulator [Lutimaribacter sp. EGI FJ00015]|uniref:Response regulator n=1 Tax=Lutimaribacter degradans TaxID=2945989 RepID=A0ACC5ZXU1_9RHOB|nr:response regulator [Lutimaribacter sp. EGI FJ00013]MCM2562581.1 response regulator [Lutimaribacter sp. EGI FJ00013]MCO0613738.1 response regulator [Lutimaribacter sp. EGI FJ00015]MCO0636779.1 response regulator [Lutimaribacter sp. EGI FJ00014]